MDTTTRQPGRGLDSRDPSIVWFAEECLNNSVPLEGYVRAAERAHDRQLAEFFRRALDETRRVQHGDPRLGRLRHAAHIAEFGGV